MTNYVVSGIYHPLFSLNPATFDTVLADISDKKPYVLSAGGAVSADADPFKPEVTACYIQVKEIPQTGLPSALPDLTEPISIIVKVELAGATSAQTPTPHFSYTITEYVYTAPLIGGAVTPADGYNNLAALWNTNRGRPSVNQVNHTSADLVGTGGGGGGATQLSELTDVDSSLILQDGRGLVYAQVDGKWRSVPSTSDAFNLATVSGGGGGLGTGEIFRDFTLGAGDGTRTMNFRSLQAGTNVSVVDAGDNIIINASGSTTTGDIEQGGNTFGAAVVVGTQDNFPSIVLANNEQILQCDPNGTIEALQPNYETLVVGDQTLVNKKYVDNSLATQNYSTLADVNIAQQASGTVARYNSATLKYEQVPELKIPEATSNVEINTAADCTIATGGKTEVLATTVNIEGQNAVELTSDASFVDISAATILNANSTAAIQITAGTDCTIAATTGTGSFLSDNSMTLGSNSGQTTLTGLTKLTLGAGNNKVQFDVEAAATGILEINKTGDVTGLNYATHITGNDLAVPNVYYVNDLILESTKQHSTGILSDGANPVGLLSIGAPTTTYSISDGNGSVVAQTGVQTAVSWTGLTNLVIPDPVGLQPGDTPIAAGDGLIANRQSTYVSIDDTGAVVLSGDIPTNASQRDYIFLGTLVHIHPTPLDNTLQAVIDTQVPQQWVGNQLKDLSDALGIFNSGGNLISKSTGGDLKLYKTEGTAFQFGANYHHDIRNPHNVALPELDTAIAGLIQYQMQDGSSSAPTVITDVNNLIFDDGTAYPGGVFSNPDTWGAQRVFVFPAFPGTFVIQPAQVAYSSESAATAGISTELFTVDLGLAESALLIGYIVQNSGDASLTTATFLQANKFGSGGGGVGSADISGKLNIDGTSVMTGNFNIGGNAIVNTGTLSLPTTTDTLVGRDTTDTLTSKTLTAPIISTISNTGTLTLPITTDTLVGRDTTDTLTNKTLTAPIISTISNTGTLTLPTTTDTLVGKDTTDTLTNKTIDYMANTLTLPLTNLSDVSQVQAPVANDIVVRQVIAGGYADLDTLPLPPTVRYNNAGIDPTNPVDDLKWTASVAPVGKLPSVFSKGAVAGGAVFQTTPMQPAEASSRTGLLVNGDPGVEEMCYLGLDGQAPGGDFTLIIVCSNVEGSGGDSNRFLGVKDDATTSLNQGALLSSWVNTTFQTSFCHNVASDSSPQSQALDINVGTAGTVIPMMMMFQYTNGGNFTITTWQGSSWVKTVNLTTAAFTFMANYTLNYASLMVSATTTTRAKGTIGEVLYYNSVLSTPQVDSIKDSLKAYFVDIDNSWIYKPYELVELGDVAVVAPLHGQAVTYNTAGTNYQNQNLLWKDLIGYIENPTGNPTDPPGYTVFRTPHYSYSMRSTGPTKMYFKFHPNHDWEPGLDFDLHLHFATNAAAETGLASFNPTVSIAQIDGIFPVSTVLAPIQHTFIGAGDQFKHKVIEVPFGRPGGGANLVDSDLVDVDSIIMLEIEYDDAVSTVAANDQIFVFQSDIHYQSYGSLGTFSKNPPFDS